MICHILFDVLVFPRLKAQKQTNHPHIERIGRLLAALDRLDAKYLQRLSSDLIVASGSPSTLSNYSEMIERDQFTTQRQSSLWQCKTQDLPRSAWAHG